MADTTERPGRRVALLRREYERFRADAAEHLAGPCEGCGVCHVDALMSDALAAARRERWRLGEAIEAASRRAASAWSEYDNYEERAVGRAQPVSDREVSLLRRAERCDVARRRLSALADRLAREVPEAALQRERAARQEEARKRREGQRRA